MGNADGNAVSSTRQWARRLARHLVTPLLPVRVVTDAGGLAQAEALVDDGYGLIALMNHFSLRDAFEVLRLLYSRPGLRSRPTLAPVASHRAGRGTYLLGDLFAVDLCPITSPEVAAVLGPDAPPAADPLAYAQQAVATLSAGGLVPLSPQAGRRPALVRPDMRPLSLLMAQARRRRVNDVALLPVGLGIHGESDYSLENAGGLNLGRLYEIGIGRAFTAEEAVNAAGGWRNLDDWALAKLAPLVPAAYRGEAW